MKKKWYMLMVFWDCCFRSACNGMVPKWQFSLAVLCQGQSNSLLGHSFWTGLLLTNLSNLRMWPTPICRAFLVGYWLCVAGCWFSCRKARLSKRGELLKRERWTLVHWEWNFFLLTLVKLTCFQVLCELPASGNWNFDVQWSPCTPGVLSTSSFDGQIGIYNIEVLDL